MAKNTFTSKYISTLYFLSVILFFLFIGIIIGHYGIADKSKTVLSLPELQNADEIREFLFSEIKADSIRAFLKDLTNQSHTSGTRTNEEVGQFIFDSFKNSGLSSVKFASFDVLLSRPNETDPNSVRIVNNDGSLDFQLSNRENTTESNKYFESAYFAYSAQGTVEGDKVFYVNQAKDYDFQKLEKLGIDLNGSIIMVRNGGGFRGDTVARAQKFGVKAVLLFSDPSLVAPKGISRDNVLPKSKWMPGSVMERGSLFTGEGDPLSQGFVSEPLEKMSYRQTMKDSNLPNILALPIGYADAQKLFNLMVSNTKLPETANWAPSPYMNYSVGGILSAGRKIVIKVTNYPEIKRIRNVIGTIAGSKEPDRYVLLGNHYDAWTFGGIDPNSGTAVMLEMARIMGELFKKGAWKPSRTIVFGAWDAEEYGLIGSTEWVESNLQILYSRAVAYINCDAAVRGGVTFSASSMPLLTDLIFAATKTVADPLSVPPGSPTPSVYDVWGKNWSQGIPRVFKVSSSSDYASFVEQIGVPSADIMYIGDHSNPAYHTAFETFEYVDTFIDPGFVYHVALTKVWTEIVRDLADSVLLPFSVTNLASDIVRSWKATKRGLLEEKFNFTAEINADLMDDAIKVFADSADDFTVEIKKKLSSMRITDLETRELNDRLLGIERMFVDPNGIPGRPLTRHVLQAPPKSSIYGSSSFPGIADCVAFTNDAIQNYDEKGKAFWLKELKEHVVKVAQMIHRAAVFLKPPAIGLD